MRRCWLWRRLRIYFRKMIVQLNCSQRFVLHSWIKRSKILVKTCGFLLLTYHRVVRDQANKTLDLYLQRIRKYSQCLPDSVLPPPEAAGQNAPRMSTPQPETAGSGWAGWAISSFTNKLASASGEIQPNSSAAATSGPERPASTPPANQGSSAAQSLSMDRTRPTPVISPSAPTVPRVSSGLRNATPITSDVEHEDFGDAWGEMDEDGAADAADAWAEMDDSVPVAAPPRAPVAAFDDGGEPDFAGWLNAQAQAKSKAKNPLPKGLSKSKPAASASRPAVARNASASTAGKAKPAAKAVPSKPVQPAATDDDDDWGEAWG